MLRRPDPLKKGDLVALTAPASPSGDKGVQKAFDSLRFLGLRPLVLESCLHTEGYLAGPDRLRADDLNRAFGDPAVRGIFCLRGGYGSCRLLPLLDLSLIRKNPKIFVGFSDITALHLVFNQLCGFVTFHGPMPSAGYEALDLFTLDSLKKNLFHIPAPPAPSGPKSDRLKVLFPGKASGILTGGNLSVIAGTLGSPYEIDTRGRILFLEDVGEQPYRIDRALSSLALAGKFRDCAGIVLGTFSQCQRSSDGSDTENTDQFSLFRIFSEILGPCSKPVLYGLPAGHTFPQMTLPLGAEASFDSQTRQLHVRL